MTPRGEESHSTVPTDRPDTDGPSETESAYRLTSHEEELIDRALAEIRAGDFATGDELLDEIAALGLTGARR